MTYTDLIRTALRNRYGLIQYYYSRFQHIHDFGGSFFKPLFFDWPNDPNAYKKLEENILIGDALKVSMATSVIDDKTPQTSYYFPEG